MSRKYWIMFRVHQPGGHVVLGQSEVTRELPITCAADLNECGQIIFNAMAKQLPQGCGIEVYDWRKFEEASIAIATSH